MIISPDEMILFSWNNISINATIVFTWIVMMFLVLISWLATRRVSSAVHISAKQNLMEIVVAAIRDQIKEISNQKGAERYIPFVGTLFLFIIVSNILVIIPGFRAPTGSFSTTVALSLCVFVAVPFYGIISQGIRDYLSSYLKPNIIMLPFNIIGEISRTLALAVRLYGNMMSGTVIIAILLGIVPLFFPIVMQVFGLLTGVIQAYIFSILAMVYIASASKITRHKNNEGGE